MKKKPIKRILALLLVGFSFAPSLSVYGSTSNVDSENKTISSTAAKDYGELQASKSDVIGYTGDVQEKADETENSENKPDEVTKSPENSLEEEAETTDKRGAINNSTISEEHRFWDKQWDMKMVTDNGKSYTQYTPSKNISVAIVDSGVMENHGDLADSLGNHLENFVSKGGFDNEEPDEDGDVNSIADKMGHGTEVAGQITANGYILGIAPDIPINIYRVFGESLAKPEWMADAIKKAADDGNKIIN